MSKGQKRIASGQAENSDAGFVLGNAKVMLKRKEWVQHAIDSPERRHLMEECKFVLEECSTLDLIEALAKIARSVTPDVKRSAVEVIAIASAQQLRNLSSDMSIYEVLEFPTEEALTHPEV